MKDSFKLEILKTNKELTTEEQETFREEFKPLLNQTGIMALCLEAKELYIEFNPTLLNLDSFKLKLIELGFPVKREAVNVS
ncbi:hypothetical protein [Algibacter luteus]|uniref:hypothetical protein n=1 Tax=Algibacter luteus TaxID=1178825 RepID=UPI0025981EBA|nr:hypothetical protein [Algibacter luteus]WJJ96419.1 hypothetical protein O5O44_14485 [Algibacter luteus]